MDNYFSAHSQHARQFSAMKAHGRAKADSESATLDQAAYQLVYAALRQVAATSDICGPSFDCELWAQRVSQAMLATRIVR